LSQVGTFGLTPGGRPSTLTGEDSGCGPDLWTPAGTQGSQLGGLRGTVFARITGRNVSRVTPGCM
jgi:hypothetical protein